MFTRQMLLPLVMMLGIMAPQSVRADQNEETAVAIWFIEADGSEKPYYFYDINAPFMRWSCEARLDYLTRMFYRMTRSNPDLKAKKAARSACVPLTDIQ